MKAIKKLIEDATKKDSLDNLSRKELEGLIEKIYAEANAKIELEEVEEKEYNTLEVEAIQDLTWTFCDGMYPYYEDSRDRFEILRGWGCEFEEWWKSLSEDEREKTDYFTEVYRFGDKKMKNLRYPDLRDRLQAIAKEVADWKSKDIDEKNILTKLNCIIDQLKKEE